MGERALELSSQDVEPSGAAAGVTENIAILGFMRAPVGANRLSTNRLVFGALVA